MEKDSKNENQNKREQFFNYLCWKNSNEQVPGPMALGK